MANRTDPVARSVHGTNPQFLIGKIVRSRIYADNYWKEFCFGLTADSLIDEAAQLKYIGGTFGGGRRPCSFLCLILKMLQIQPEKEIIIEYIRQEDFKYLRALGAFYLRLIGSHLDVYSYLEPLLNDYRRLRHRTPDGKFQLIHMDSFIDQCLKRETVLDVDLPGLPKRHVLEESQALQARVSVLDDELEWVDEGDSDMEAEEQVDEPNNAKWLKGVDPRPDEQQGVGANCRHETSRAPGDNLPLPPRLDAPPRPRDPSPRRHRRRRSPSISRRGGGRRGRSRSVSHEANGSHRYRHSRQRSDSRDRDQRRGDSPSRRNRRRGAPRRRSVSNSRPDRHHDREDWDRRGNGGGNGRSRSPWRDVRHRTTRQRSNSRHRSYSREHDRRGRRHRANRDVSYSPRRTQRRHRRSSDRRVSSRDVSDDSRRGTHGRDRDTRRRRDASGSDSESPRKTGGDAKGAPSDSESPRKTGGDAKGAPASDNETPTRKRQREGEDDVANGKHDEDTSQARPKKTKKNPLGLKLPLAGKEKPKETKTTRAEGGGGKDELSVEQTNAVRQELGLAPLK